MSPPALPDQCNVSVVSGENHVLYFRVVGQSEGAAVCFGAACPESDAYAENLLVEPPHQGVADVVIVVVVRTYIPSVLSDTVWPYRVMESTALGLPEMDTP